MKLYEQVAQDISTKIDQHYYEVGDKLPSIRVLCSEYNISISTAQSAYRWLETQGVVFAKSKSGYYVSPQNQEPKNTPSVSRPTKRPIEVPEWENVLDLLFSGAKKDSIQLSLAVPDITAPTLKPLTKIMHNMERHARDQHLVYAPINGSLKLRTQIARIMIESGCGLHPDDIITTSGCQESLGVSLHATAEAGSVIAVDSPSFYGSLQAIRANHMKALEIPTDPNTGISLQALEMALEQWPIKAVQVTPTCNNPLGYTMPVEHKQRLIDIANEHDIIIIEDDIYGDLSFASPRPPSIKSFDTDGRVILCSSFSKTLAPGLRVGWIAPGKHYNQVLHTKYSLTSSPSGLPENSLAEFIAQGGYERHLRAMRKQYKLNRGRMIQWIEKYLPKNTKISYPNGGFLLWVELEKHIDTKILNEYLRTQKITVSPGIIFSANQKYKNCMRLNYQSNEHKKNEYALKIIGNAIKNYNNLPTVVAVKK